MPAVALKLRLAYLSALRDSGAVERVEWRRRPPPGFDEWPRQSGMALFIADYACAALVLSALSPSFAMSTMTAYSSGRKPRP